MFINSYYMYGSTSHYDKGSELSFGDQIPYNVNMKYLEVWYDDDLLKRFTLNLCNDNGVCDGNENSFTCLSDCDPLKLDNLCNNEKDGFCDKDCFKGVDSDCGNSKSYILIFVGVVILLISFFVWKKKKSRPVIQTNQQVSQYYNQ